MSAAARGMTVAQATGLAKDAATSQAILVQLANGYPETWQLLLVHPNMYPDLKEWIERAQAAASAPPNSAAVAQAVPVAEQAKVVVEKPQPVVARQGAKTQTHAAPRKRHRQRGPVLRTLGALIPAVLLVVVIVGVMMAVNNMMPSPGTIVTENLAKPQTASNPAWTYNLSASDDPNSCLYYDVKTFEQNVAIVLSQNDLTDTDCRDAEKPPADTLALLNTKTGEQFWKVTLAEELPWSTEWKKEIVSAPGLDAILVKFIDINSTEKDKDKTLVPFNRLNGKVTDAFIATNKNDPPPATPMLEVMQIPGNSRDLLVFTGGSEKEYRYSYFRAKKLSTPEWKYESDLKPIGSMPLVGNYLLLGRKAGDVPEAVSLSSGTPQAWPGEPGGKIVNVDGSYVQVHGDGVDIRLNNRDSWAGGKDTADDEDDENASPELTLTGISSTGTTLWSQKVAGYALARDSSASTNITRSHFSALFTVSDDGTAFERIDPQTGEVLWTQSVNAAHSEVAQVAGAATFFILNTVEGEAEATTESVFSLKRGNELGILDVANANTRIDAVAAQVGYQVDEPKRSEVESDDDASVESVQTSEEDPEEMKKERVCLNVFGLTSGASLWTMACNGYEHVGIAGGNLIVVDKTPGQALIRSVRSQ